jgi:hypothetical protein
MVSVYTQMKAFRRVKMFAITHMRRTLLDPH